MACLIHRGHSIVGMRETPITGSHIDWNDDDAVSNRQQLTAIHAGGEVQVTQWYNQL